MYTNIPILISSADYEDSKECDLWFWLRSRVELARILLGLGRLEDAENVINVGIAEAENVHETIISRALR